MVGFSDRAIKFRKERQDTKRSAAKAEKEALAKTRAKLFNGKFVIYFDEKVSMYICSQTSEAFKKPNIEIVKGFVKASKVADKKNQAIKLANR